MSAIIVGSPISGSKVLQRQNFQRDINGLETITENYMIRTADRATLAPTKDTTHASFSTATIKYKRMAVETISFGEADGGLSTMSVVYAGLTSETLLPRPVIRMIPTFNTGVYGSPLTVEIEFVTDVTEAQLAAGQLVKSHAPTTRFIYGQTLVQMPAELNGAKTPANPRPPGITRKSRSGEIVYLGYCVDSVAAERRGQFLNARVNFKEKQYGTGVFVFANRL